MKTDIAATITATILEKLEAGTKPWVQPWTGAPRCRPLRHCGTAYRGINTVTLWMAARAFGYASPYWMTYRQAEALGGQVRRHEKCSHAVLYKTIDARDVKDGDGIIDGDDGEAPGKTRRILRSFAVFNADQIDGLPATYLISTANVLPIPESVHRPQLDAFFDRVPAVVRHSGFSAYYNRDRDEIVLPPVTRFASYDGYFATRAHETAHWTGHKKRLDRQFGTRFGDNAYAFEELVADIAAAILGAALGLPEAELENHAAYVDHWVKVLKSDKNAILTAASKADEAVNFILGFVRPGLSRMVERERPLLKAA
jgi:antirestriction protein ArdC